MGVPHSTLPFPLDLISAEHPLPPNNLRRITNPRDNLDIFISPKANCDASVRCIGEKKSVVSYGDLESFGICGNDLKDAIKMHWGKRPDFVYVKSPTPWRFYEKNDNCDEVTKTVKVDRAEVQSVETTTTTVATRRYINNSDVSGTFTTTFTENVTNTVSSTWSSGHSFDAGLNYNFNFPLSANLSYSKNFSEESNVSKSTSVNTESSVSVTLEPGESVLVHLRSRKHKLRVKIIYEISLQGDVIASYPENYKNHYNWALDVNSILKSAKKPTVLRSSDTLDVTYYAGGDIILDRINADCSSTNSFCSRHGVRDYYLGQ